MLGVGDRVGAIVFNDGEFVEIRARRSRATVLQILSAIVAQNQALGVGRGLVSAPIMLNTALQHAERRALHDATIIVISDFDGADDTTRKMIGAMTQHNNVVALLVHDQGVWRYEQLVQLAGDFCATAARRSSPEKAASQENHASLTSGPEA